MAKSNKKYHRRQQRSFPWFPIGLGLFLIVMAILILTSPKSDGNAANLSSVVPVEVNFNAPELSLQNINGQTESFADFRGSVVLVNNWATWCPPCKAEMPTLAAYHNEHASEGFTIIAIESVSQFASDYNLKFPVWLDPDGASLRAFGNGTLPNSYVIDRAGTVRFAWTGEISQDMLEKYVTPLLQEN
jgi:thiol-disulfide isomerase/thioredoxin